MLGAATAFDREFFLHSRNLFFIACRIVGFGGLGGRRPVRSCGDERGFAVKSRVVVRGSKEWTIQHVLPFEDHSGYLIQHPGSPVHSIPKADRIHRESPTAVLASRSNTSQSYPISGPAAIAHPLAGVAAHPSQCGR